MEPLLHDTILRNVPEIDGYKVLRPCILFARVGSGGMGVVYRGKHVKFNIDVGVKCLLPQFGDGPLVSRFEREARVAAMLNHQNLVRVFDVDCQHGLRYLVMEFVEGETARQRVERKGAHSVGEAVQILIGAAKGLAAAHENGILHRDIKPDNILISRRGVVKLADLGLSRINEAVDAKEAQMSQCAMGSPRYMPPEQWDGLDRVGKEGDVWALGATLYFLLVGEDAFNEDSQRLVMRRVCSEPFPDIAATLPALPGDLLEILGRCTDRNPAQRYSNAHELVDALDDLSRKYNLDMSVRPEVQGEPGRLPEGIVPPPAELVARVRAQLEEGIEAEEALVPRLSDTSDPFASTTRVLGRAAAGTPARAFRRPLLTIGVAVALLTAALLTLFSGGAPEPARERQATAQAAEPARVDGRQRSAADAAADSPGGAAEATPGGTDAQTSVTAVRTSAGTPEPTAGAPAAEPGERGGPEPAPIELDGFVSLGRNEQGYPEYRHHGTGIVFVHLPAATFWMGSDDSVVGRRSDERPRHRVPLDAFLIAKYEVRQSEWQALMGAPASFFKGEDLPVEKVTWEEARGFCELASPPLSLPSEAQWEYACRANTDTAFAFGDTIDTDQVNYDGNFPYGEGRRGVYRRKTVPVDSFAPNAFGLYNMHGNVREWCLDDFDPQFYERAAATERNPVAQGGPRGKVVRGGDWYENGATYCRSAYRRGAPADSASPHTGFRPVCFPLP